MNTYGKRGVFFSVTEKPWSSLKTGQSAWGGVWGGEVPRPINFLKICLEIVHSGVTFLQNFNTKFLVYYLIIPLKNFFVMPKVGQAQHCHCHCQQLERTLFAVLFLIICCNNSDHCYSKYLRRRMQTFMIVLFCNRSCS